MHCTLNISVRYGYGMSQKQISEKEASKEVSQQILSGTEATAEVKSHKRHKKKARKVDKDADYHVTSIRYFN